MPLETTVENLAIHFNDIICALEASTALLAHSDSNYETRVAVYEGLGKGASVNKVN